METPSEESMAALADKFGIPTELQAFVDAGFLEPLSENDAEKTVELHIPSMQYKDEQGRITDFSIVWIHPDFNAQFCHYYDETPGDLVNFYVRKETTDLGDEELDIATLDDLLCWLEERRSDR